MLVTYNVKGMSFHAFHGSLEVERELGQLFSIDVAVTHEVEIDKVSPNMGAPVHGADIYEWTKNVVTGTKYQSHSGLAMAIAKTLLDRCPAILSAHVSITRKHLFIAGDVEEIVIEVSCDRDDFKKG